MRIGRFAVIPGHLGDSISARSAFLGIELAQLVIMAFIIHRSSSASPDHQRPCIATASSVAVADTAFLFERRLGREQKDLGLDIGRIYPGRFQYSPVSVIHNSDTIIHSSLSIALRCALAFGPLTAGFMPQAIIPLIVPASIASNRGIQE